MAIFFLRGRKTTRDEPSISQLRKISLIEESRCLMIASVLEIDRVAMLTIRREQMNVLSTYMLRSFQDRMVKQIATDFPKQYKDLGEPGARNLVQQGINKAGKHGIERECDVATLIELMLEFSPDFEAQPGRAWAPRVLNHPTLSGQAKVESLCLRMKGRTRAS